MSARKTAVDRVEAYVEQRTGMRGIDPDEINSVWRTDEQFTLSLSDLRELLAQAKELAALKSQTLVFWQGDWAARVDAEGNLIDQGHHDDVLRRVVEELMGETHHDEFPFNRRVPEGTNLRDLM